MLRYDRALNDVGRWLMYGSLPALYGESICGIWGVGRYNRASSNQSGRGTSSCDTQLSHTSQVRPGQRLRIHARSPLSISILHGHLEEVSLLLRGEGGLDRFSVREGHTGLGVHLQHPNLQFRA
jgi:hypothetical protein